MTVIGTGYSCLTSIPSISFAQEHLHQFFSDSGQLALVHTSWSIVEEVPLTGILLSTAGWGAPRMCQTPSFSPSRCVNWASFLKFSSLP